jgi:ABC-type Fe2+-enterobactin transport system substrate-binding protein
MVCVQLGFRIRRLPFASAASRSMSGKADLIYLASDNLRDAELAPIILMSELQPAFDAIHAAVKDGRRPVSRPRMCLSSIE